MQHGTIFGVKAGGQLYFARSQFDDPDEPRPVIGDILAEPGPAVDPWTITMWFHFPNGWIIEEGGSNRIAPKDALDRPVEVLNAARLLYRTFAA